MLAIFVYSITASVTPARRDLLHPGGLWSHLGLHTCPSTIHFYNHITPTPAHTRTQRTSKTFCCTSLGAQSSPMAIKP